MYSTVCSLHFLPSDFKEGCKVRRLKRGAIPTLRTTCPAKKARLEEQNAPDCDPPLLSPVGATEVVDFSEYPQECAEHSGASCDLSDNPSTLGTDSTDSGAKGVDEPIALGTCDRAGSPSRGGEVPVQPIRTRGVRVNVSAQASALPLECRKWRRKQGDLKA